MDEEPTQYTTMFGVQNFEFEDDIDAPIRLKEGVDTFLLFPKKSKMLWDACNEETERSIEYYRGTFELNRLKNNWMVAFCPLTIADLDDSELFEFQNALIGHMDGLLNTLWIVRDHAASVVPGWSLDASSKRFQLLCTSISTCKSDGSGDTVAFSRGECGWAVALNDVLFSSFSRGGGKHAQDVGHFEQ